MTEKYNEIDFVNETDDDQTLFYKHVVAEDRPLADVDELLKKAFSASF